MSSCMSRERQPVLKMKHELVTADLQASCKGAQSNINIRHIMYTLSVAQYPQIVEDESH